MTLVTLKNITCEMGGQLLFQTERLTISEGDVIGLIGKNGAGKTCLLQLLANQLQEFSGEKIGNPLIEFHDVNIMDTIEKSGGETSVAHFLSSLRNHAALFLLDEPTTYLDQKNSDKVIRTIQHSQAAFCIASHDRAFLEAVATKIWVIEQKKITEYDCGFSDYIQERAYQSIQYEQEMKTYRREKKKLKESIQAMKEKRDQKKGKPKKMSASEYRITGVKTKINVKQKKLQKGIAQQEQKLHQLKQPDRITEAYDISFLTQINRLPKRQIVIPAHEAKIGAKRLWKLPAITLRSGDKLGVIGQNGSGKTTFLNYLRSTLPKTYKVGYFQQAHVHFPDEKMTVYSVIADKADNRLDESQIRTLLALLDFKREKAFRKIGQLSRGETVKIALLALLVSELDVLILDEVTNFLDLKTIEAVEQVLLLSPSILVFVSHDQYFTEHLATAILKIDDYKDKE